MFFKPEFDSPVKRVTTFNVFGDYLPTKKEKPVKINLFFYLLLPLKFAYFIYQILMLHFLERKYFIFRVSNSGIWYWRKDDPKKSGNR